MVTALQTSSPLLQPQPRTGTMRIAWVVRHHNRPCRVHRLFLEILACYGERADIIYWTTNSLYHSTYCECRSCLQNVYFDLCAQRALASPPRTCCLRWRPRRLTIAGWRSRWTWGRRSPAWCGTKGSTRRSKRSASRLRAREISLGVRTPLPFLWKTWMHYPLPVSSRTWHWRVLESVALFSSIWNFFNLDKIRTFRTNLNAQVSRLISELGCVLELKWPLQGLVIFHTALGDFAYH